MMSFMKRLKALQVITVKVCSKVVHQSRAIQAGGAELSYQGSKLIQRSSINFVIPNQDKNCLGTGASITFYRTRKKNYFHILAK